MTPLIFNYRHVAICHLLCSQQVASNHSCHGPSSAWLTLLYCYGPPSAGKSGVYLARFVARFLTSTLIHHIYSIRLKIRRSSWVSGVLHVRNKNTCIDYRLAEVMSFNLAEAGFSLGTS